MNLFKAFGLRKKKDDNPLVYSNVDLSQYAHPDRVGTGVPAEFGDALRPEWTHEEDDDYRKFGYIPDKQRDWDYGEDRQYFGSGMGFYPKDRDIKDRNPWDENVPDDEFWRWEGFDNPYLGSDEGAERVKGRAVRSFSGGTGSAQEEEQGGERMRRGRRPRFDYRHGDPDGKPLSGGRRKKLPWQKLLKQEEAYQRRVGDTAQGLHRQTGTASTMAPQYMSPTAKVARSKSIQAIAHDDVARRDFKTMEPSLGDMGSNPSRPYNVPKDAIHPDAGNMYRPIEGTPEGAVFSTSPNNVIRDWQNADIANWQAYNWPNKQFDNTPPKKMEKDGEPTEQDIIEQKKPGTPSALQAFVDAQKKIAESVPEDESEPEVKQREKSKDPKSDRAGVETKGRKVKKPWQTTRKQRTKKRRMDKLIKAFAPPATPKAKEVNIVEGTPPVNDPADPESFPAGSNISWTREFSEPKTGGGGGK